MTPLQAAAEREEIRKVAQIAKEKCRRGGLNEVEEQLTAALRGTRE